MMEYNYHYIHPLNRDEMDSFVSHFDSFDYQISDRSLCIGRNSLLIWCAILIYKIETAIFQHSTKFHEQTTVFDQWSNAVKSDCNH